MKARKGEEKEALKKTVKEERDKEMGKEENGKK